MTNSLVFFEVTGSFFAVSDPSISSNLNIPTFQPINGLVTFMPRLPQGQLMYVSDLLITAAYSAEQTINLLGQPTGGTFTLQYGINQTSPLPWDATPSQVQTALTGLASIGANNVIVTAGVEPYSYNVEFTGSLSNQAIAPIDGDADLLLNAEGEGYCEITVTPTALGSPQIAADAAIALPTLQARIWNGVLSTIDVADTPGFQLCSNSPVLNLQDELIYDVSFDSVTYNGVGQTLAPYGFVAPIDDTGICLTDPEQELVPYCPTNEPPYTDTWAPPGTTPMNSRLQVVGSRAGVRAAARDWRTAHTPRAKVVS